MPSLGIRKRIGEYWLGKELEPRRGDADVLGFVRGDNGWEFVPCNIRTEGDMMWFDPLDDDEKPYPADGVPAQPPRLMGCPIAIGYKDFGALSELTNVEIARDVIIDLNADQDADDEGDADEEEPSLRERLSQWYRSKKTGLSEWWGDVRWRKGWGWAQGKSDALIIEEDGDNAVITERADFTAGTDEPDWFETRSAGYYYDARGRGAEPAEGHNADLAIAYAEIPRLLAPSVCRLARNMFEKRIEDGTYQYGGNVRDDRGRAVADGGQVQGDAGDGTPGGFPNPKVAQPGDGAIEVEERAFIDPEDVKLLGGAQETQDKIQTLIDQIEAKENTPGGTLRDNILRYGMVFLAFILGAVLGGGGGGGGGGGVGTSLPFLIDPTAFMGRLTEVVALVGV